MAVRGGRHLADPLAPPGDSLQRDWSMRTFRAMGCQMSLTVDGDVAPGALDQAQEYIELVEATLSRFRPESDLRRLNARAGTWVGVSPLLHEVVRVALRAAAATGGLCTPTLLDALEAAGYDRDFGQVQRTATRLTGEASCDPGHAAGPGSGPPLVARRRLRAAHSQPGRRHQWRGVRLSGAGNGVRLPDGVRLDLAGVAKGWTADRVADLLTVAGPCLVDAGGDLAARGAPAGLPGWPVAIASPTDPAQDLGMVYLRDAGIATSGTDYRRWVRRGQIRHHLIDPRTGRPSRTDALSVTVIARTALAADIHAKAVLLLGMRRGQAYLASRDLAGLFVRNDGRCTTTAHWRRYAIEDVA